MQALAATVLPEATLAHRYAPFCGQPASSRHTVAQSFCWPCLTHRLPAPPHTADDVHSLPRFSSLANGCACGSLSIPLTPMNAVWLGAALSVLSTSSQVTGTTAVV